VDPTGFNSWAGRGVASSILPNVKESTFATRMKMLEKKVASMEAQHRIAEARIAVLEQRTSFEKQSSKILQLLFKYPLIWLASVLVLVFALGFGSSTLP